MRWKIKIITQLIVILLMVPAHLVFAGEETLGRYVETGIQNNLALKQRQFSLKQSMQALREAKGMFLPSVGIEARYSRAGGGRNIEMPIGDLVNPMHHSLNQLLMQHGIPGSFPGNIANESIPFLRKTEHETKIRIVQPVFQPGIYYNFKIKKDLTGIEKAKVDAFKRQLTADIKTAYFNYLKTLKVKELLQDTRKLLEENLTISRSLFKNHKRTEEVVFRSQAELSNLEQKIAESEKNVRVSASYFNFLLNRKLDEPIDVPGSGVEPGTNKQYQLETLTARALEHREEFRQLSAAVNAASHTAGMHKAGILPTVSAVFDYGFQGEKYSFTGKDDYWMGSLVFSWNLYKGGQDAAKRKQALYQKKRLEAQQEELVNKIKLQVQEGFHNLEVASKSVVSTGDALKSSKEALHIVTRKYREGMVPQIEYLKARNDFTSAAVSNIIAIYDYHIKKAQLERISAAQQL